MIFTSTLFGFAYGFVVGMLWCFALNYPFKGWLMYSIVLAFSGIALFLAIAQKTMEVKMNQESRQQTRANGHVLFMLLVVGIVTGLVALLIRLIFF